MLHPEILTAVGGLGPTLSVIVPFCAAILGAIAGGVARWHLDRLADRAEFRATVWVIGIDLARLQAHLRARPAGQHGGMDRSRDVDPVWWVLDGWSPADRRVLSRGLCRDVATLASVQASILLAARYRSLLAQHAEAPDALAHGFVRELALHRELTKSVALAIQGLARHAGRDPSTSASGVGGVDPVSSP